MNPFLQEVVAEAVRRQPWYQKNANTIVAGLVALSAVLSFVATLGLDLPPIVAAGIPAAVTLIGTLVTKLTRNGVQMSTLGKLESTAASRSDQGRSLIEAEIDRVSGYVGKHRLDT